MSIPISDSSSPTPGTIRFPLSAYGPFLLLAGLAILIYAKIFAFHLTGLDDTTLIASGSASALSFKSFLAMFSSALAPDSFQFFYRPLLMISFIIDAHLHPYIPFIFPATNIVIHVVAASFLFIFLRQITRRPGVALFLAAVFTVHPVLTPAVAWIPGRNDSLLGLFVLATFISYARFQESGNRWYYAAHMLCFAGVLFVKETGIATLVLLVCYPFFIGCRKNTVRQIYSCYAGWAVIVGLWLFLRAHAAGMQHAGTPAAFTSLGTSLPALLHYLGKAVFPVQLSNLATQKDTTSLYGIAALALVIPAIIFSKTRKNGLVLFGTAWFLVFLLPTLLFQNDFKLEHRSYVPIMGLLLVASTISLPAFMSERWRQALQALVIAVLGVLAFVYADIFSGPLIFWTNAAKTSPRNPWVHSGLGKTYAAMRLGGPALQELERAYELEPKYTPNSSIFAFDLGALLINAGKDTEAERVFKDASAAGNGNYSKIYFLYGSLCQRQKRMQEAVHMYQQALRINPRYIDYYRGLIGVYESQGRTGESARYRGMIQRLAKNEGASLMYIDDTSARWLSGIMRDMARNPAGEQIDGTR